MYRVLCLGVVLVSLLAGPVLAQSFHDPFTYTSGTTVPGYTEQRGDWKVLANMVQADPTVTFQELTHSKIGDLDCCVEVTVIYDKRKPQLMYAGPIVRHNGTGSKATYIMIKLQDNGSPYTGFDRGFTYYYNGSSFSYIGTYFDLKAPTTMARVRLQVVDLGTSVQVQSFVDADMDGKWDIVRTATTPNLLGKSGNIGISAYRNSFADDLKFFDAVMWLGAAPKIGTLVKILGRSQPRMSYMGACSFGNGLIKIDSARSVPLAPDSLFFTSLLVPSVFQAFKGTTSTTGDFTMGLNIPNLPALKGITCYASAVIYNTLGIAEIAPDTEITFQ